MMGRTLLLNSTYEPLTVISWKRAVTLSFLGKVEVLRNYDQRIHSVSLVLPMPAVVRLISFIRRKRPRISFSRRNLFARDGYRCQYCARRGDASELTCDHVMPRSRGGTT